jgi:DNA-binding response OmpR family regulator
MDTLQAMESRNPLDDGIGGRVLVVDDNATARTTHRGILARRFDVLTAASGKEALDRFDELQPDLVLLDADMPGMDGYETCRQLRARTTVPIIFATAHQALEEHLKAYDAGGNDLITKPVNSELLLRKVTLSIAQHRAMDELAIEKASLQKMAMQFLSSMGGSGTLMRFAKAGMLCRNHHALAQNLLEAAGDLGVDCSVSIRHEGGPTLLSLHSGEPFPLERAIIDGMSDTGGIFQFRRRLVVNYGRVSLFVIDMPDEETMPEEAGRLRNNLITLAEIAEALCDNVDMRIESAVRAEQLQVALGGAEQAAHALREKHKVMLNDIRMLLQQMLDEVEKSFNWLGASIEQEAAIHRTLNPPVQRILERLIESGDFDRDFDTLLAALRGSSTHNDIDFF